MELISIKLDWESFVEPIVDWLHSTRPNSAPNSLNLMELTVDDLRDRVDFSEFSQIFNPIN